MKNRQLLQRIYHSLRLYIDQNCKDRTYSDDIVQYIITSQIKTDDQTEKQTIEHVRNECKAFQLEFKYQFGTKIDFRTSLFLRMISITVYDILVYRFIIAEMCERHGIDNLTFEYLVDQEYNMLKLIPTHKQVHELIDLQTLKSTACYSGSFRHSLTNTDGITQFLFNLPVNDDTEIPEYVISKLLSTSLLTEYK